MDRSVKPLAFWIVLAVLSAGTLAYMYGQDLGGGIQQPSTGGGGGGGGTWGSITGTLSAQTDLATALAGKQASLGFTPLNAASNLSDVASSTTARTNLGLGTAAVANIGTSSGTVASGTDSRFGAFTTITPTATSVAAGATQEYYLHLQIPYTALTLASTVQDVALFTTSSGFKLRGLTLVETTSFSCSACSGITSMTAAVGRGATSPSDYQLPTPLMQTAGTMRDAGGNYSPVFASHTVYVEFTNTTAATPSNFGNGTASNLTAGLLDVYVWYVTAL